MSGVCASEWAWGWGEKTRTNWGVRKNGKGSRGLGSPTYPRWQWNGIWCGIHLTEFLGVDWQRHRDDFRFITEREAESFDLEQRAT